MARKKKNTIVVVVIGSSRTSNGSLVFFGYTCINARFRMNKIFSLILIVIWLCACACALMAVKFNLSSLRVRIV